MLAEHATPVQRCSFRSCSHRTFRGVHAVLPVVVVIHPTPKVVVLALVTSVLVVAVSCLCRDPGDAPWLIVAVGRDCHKTGVYTAALEVWVEQESPVLAADRANKHDEMMPAKLPLPTFVVLRALDACAPRFIRRYGESTTPTLRPPFYREEIHLGHHKTQRSTTKISRQIVGCGLRNMEQVPMRWLKASVWSCG